MVSAIHTCTTRAGNCVQSMLNSDKTVTREAGSRLGAPFLAVPLLADAVANVVVGAAKAVWAFVTKVVELAFAFFGKEHNYGNFACEASNHFGKALAGVIATPFTCLLGLAVPSAALSLIRGFGLAAAPVQFVEEQKNVDLEQAKSLPLDPVAGKSVSIADRRSQSLPNLNSQGQPQSVSAA